MQASQMQLFRTSSVVHTNGLILEASCPTKIIRYSHHKVNTLCSTLFQQQTLRVAEVLLPFVRIQLVEHVEQGVGLFGPGWHRGVIEKRAIGFEPTSVSLEG